MKFLFCLVITFSSSFCWAAKVVGNGGDFRALKFIEMANGIVRVLAKQSMSGVDLEKLRKAVAEVEVESTDQRLWLNGARKDAINYPELKKIIFNRQAWDSQEPQMKIAFVFHEYLGVMGLEDSRYQLSRAFAEKTFFLSGADARALSEILNENEIYWLPVNARCLQVTNRITQAYSCFFMYPDHLSAPKISREVFYGRRARELWTLLRQFHETECIGSVCQIFALQLSCHSIGIETLFCGSYLEQASRQRSRD